MPDHLATPCTAFSGPRKIAGGALVDVALAIKALASGEAVTVFDDCTGKVIDLDLRGSTAELVGRLAKHDGPAAGTDQRQTGDGTPASRGRPKLGVVAREVTLLPRHWEWLARQPGGASQTLRRIVDEARRSAGSQAGAAARQERTYHFLSAIAGDLPGYEEAIRALFGSQHDAFAARMAGWPGDIGQHALHLAGTVMDDVA